MSTSLQKFTAHQQATAPVPATVDEAIRLGEIMAASGMFKDATDAPKAVARVIAGRELGIGPMASLQGINIIQGRVTLSANLIAGLIKRSGRYDYRATVNDTEAEVVFYEGAASAGREIGRATFSLEDAKRAKLAGDNWTKYPRDMMFARAITAGARRHTPDIFTGPVYLPEDVGYDTDPETGEVIEGTVVGQPIDMEALATERAAEIKGLSEQHGIEDMAAVWALAGVERKRDLTDDAVFAKAKAAVSGEGETGDDALATTLFGETAEHRDPQA